MKRLLAILALACFLLPAESQAIARSTPLAELARSVQSDSLQVPDHVLVIVVTPDGCYGAICRNDPVNNWDALGLDPFTYVKLGVITPEQKAKYFRKDGKYYTWAGSGEFQFLSEVGRFEGYYGLPPSVAALYAGNVAPQDQPYSTVAGAGFGSRGQFGRPLAACRTLAFA